MAVQGDFGKIQEQLETQLFALTFANSYEYSAPFRPYEATSQSTAFVRSVGLEVTPRSRRSDLDQWIAAIKWTISVERQSSESTSSYEIHEVAAVLCAGLSKWSTRDGTSTHSIHLDETNVSINLLGADGEGSETLQTATITVMGWAYRESGSTITAR